MNNEDLEDLNSGHLKHLYRELPVAKAVFTTLATRDRARMTTDLRRLRLEMISAGKKVDAEEFMKLFEELQDLGLGSLINPRRENDTHRFKWRYNLVKVAKTAMAKGPAEAPPSAQIARINVTERPISAAPGQSMTVPFRDGLLELPLPPGLTKAEAQYLADLYLRCGR